MRGFTLIELAIVLTIIGILAPLVWGFSTRIEDEATLSRWTMESADALQTVSEELRADLRAGAPIAGESVAVKQQGCTAAYTVVEGSLIRSGCGTARGLARHVESFTPVPGGADLVFARRLRPDRIHRITVFVPLEDS